LPLSEQARIEVYLPGLPKPSYQELLETLDREFTYVEALEEEAILIAVLKVYHCE
jgi:hypothetical protein